MSEPAARGSTMARSVRSIGSEQPPAIASSASGARPKRHHPAEVGLEVWTSLGDGDDDQLREHFRFWKEAGVTHVTLNNWYDRPPHRRMEERGAAAHLAAIEHYRNLVDDLL